MDSPAFLLMLQAGVNQRFKVCHVALIRGGDIESANQLVFLVNVGVGLVAVMPLPLLGRPVRIGVFVRCLLVAPVLGCLALGKTLLFLLGEVHPG